MIISRSFTATDSVADILEHLDDTGIVVFTDMTSSFTRIYNELKPHLPERIIQGFLLQNIDDNYFYYLFDSDMHTREDCDRAIWACRELR